MRFDDFFDFFFFFLDVSRLDADESLLEESRRFLRLLFFFFLLLPAESAELLSESELPLVLDELVLLDHDRLRFLLFSDFSFSAQRSDGCPIDTQRDNFREKETSN